MINKDLGKELNFIRVKLSSEDFMVPSLLKVVWPTALLLVILMLIEFLLAYPDVKSKNEIWNNDAYFSLFVSLTISFSITIPVLNYRVSYFSLPESIRKDSNLLRFIIRKVFVYSAMWLLFNLLVVPAVVYVNGLSSILASISQLVTFSLLGFLLRIDLSRYKFAALKIIVDDWRKDKNHPLILS